MFAVPRRTRTPHCRNLSGVGATLAAFTLLFCSGALLAPEQGLAQAEGRLVGTVRSQAGEPVEGATVLLQGTDIGTFTDQDGRYSLTAAAGEYTVRVQAIGFAASRRTVTISAGQSATLDFNLSTRAVELQNLLVSLAAAEVQAKELGTDIETINAAEVIEDATISDFSDLLNSRAPGVSISETSGDAGTASKIRIRGATSLTQDNNPLVYIDGVRVSNATGEGPRAIDQGDGQTVSRLDDINPQDIEDIQILKGPTAAAQYGSEAAAGVVIIRTKRGQQGAARFRVSSEGGWVSNVSDFGAQHTNLTVHGGFTDPNEPSIQQFNPIQNPVTGDVFARHNALEANPFFRKGFNFEQQLSVRGGQEDVTYYSSAQYQEDKGVTPNNWSKRFSVRGNFTATPTDKIEVSFSSNWIESNQRLTGSGRSATNVIVNSTLGLPTTGFGRNPDGSLGECLGTFLFGSPEEACERNRGFLLARAEKLLEIVNKTERRRFIGSVETNIRPTSWWSNRFSAGADVIEGRDYNIVPLDPDRPLGSRSRGEVDDFRVSQRIFTLDYASTVTPNISDHFSSSTTLGAQFFGNLRETLACQGRGGFAGPSATACNASVNFSTSTELAETNEIGAYVQQQFGFNDYLFTTAAVRIDDNSGFGANQDAIYSPSVNASAVISDMPFFNADFVDNLRLRFAWGKAAQAPGPFAADRTFIPVRIQEGGEQVSGLEPQNPGNPDLRAERNREIEFGLEGSGFGDRLSVKVSYFDQVVTDAILDRRVSPGTGFDGPQFVNIASVENSGVEGLVSGRVMDGENLTWDMNVKVQTEDPVIRDMGGLAPIVSFFQLAGMFHEGYAPGAYYGPVVVDAERDENHEIIPESVEMLPGELDISGIPNPRFIGRPQPTHQITLSQTLRLFQRLSLSAVIDRRAGHMRMDETTASSNCFIRNFAAGELCAMRQTLPPEDQWVMETDIADAPQLFVNDASFTKLREITLRWDLPPSLLQSVGALGAVESATLTIGGRNLHTWTSFPGVDPEADISAGEDAFSNTGMYGTIAPARALFGKITVVF